MYQNSIPFALSSYVSEHFAVRGVRHGIGNQRGHYLLLGTCMTDELDNSIQQNAAGPRRASADGVAAEQHPLPDQIAADKYLESKKASRAKGLGIKLAKVSPGGTV